MHSKIYTYENFNKYLEVIGIATCALGKKNHKI
jgi:hypothetical protein